METGTEDQAPPDMSRVAAPPQNGPADIQELPAPIQPPSEFVQPSQGAPLPEKWWLPSVPQQKPWSALPFAQAAFSQLPPNVAGPAITQALRLEGLLGFDADRKAGVPVAEAMSRWASKLYADHPSVAASLSHAPFTPKEVDVGGHKLIMTGPNRASFPPAPPFDASKPVNAQPVMLNGMPIPGYSAVPTAHGLHMINQSQKNMGPAQQEMILNRLINSEEQSLRNADNADEEKVITDRLKGYRKQHRELVDSLMNKGAGQSGYPPAPPRAQRKTGQPYDSPKGPHRWMGDHWETL